MRLREQARLYLRKAAQDEALLDEVLASPRVSDEIIGFHCQQAAEKLLKALLSHLGLRFRRTHDLRELLDLLTDAGHPAPAALGQLDALTPYGVVLRYEDITFRAPLDRAAARASLRQLRRWVEGAMNLPSTT